MNMCRILRSLPHCAPRRCLAPSARAFASALIALLCSACQAPERATFQGYAEGEFVLVASPFAGQLTQLSVTRGQQVTQGAPLYTLEQTAELAGAREAQAHLQRAQAEAENLLAARRTQERQAAQAAVAEAQSTLAQNQRELKRLEKLSSQGFVSEAALDAQRSAVSRDRARLQQAQAQATLTGESLGRQAERDAAQANVRAARETLAQQQWTVDQKSPRAPVSGLVADTYFENGEWVPAGRPVVSLLPPANIKLRFYVAEPALGGLKVGQGLRVTCDGCGEPIAASVSYVSVRPEYTPPVIYSKEERAKLVFLVEARPAPEQATRLKPGQPVDVQVLR